MCVEIAHVLQYIYKKTKNGLVLLHASTLGEQFLPTFTFSWTNHVELTNFCC
jgi:hypothetical protein